MVWSKGPSSGPSARPGVNQCTSLTTVFSLESEDSAVGLARLSAQTVSLILALDCLAWPLSGVVMLIHWRLPVPPPKVGENMGWVRCLALSPAVTVTHDVHCHSSCALRI